MTVGVYVLVCVRARAPEGGITYVTDLCVSVSEC